MTENSVCAVLWRRREFDCRAVDTSNIAVLPSARAIVNVVVVIVAAGVAGRHVVSFPVRTVRRPISELLVEPEGLARDAFEWQTARVVGDRWGVHMRRLAVG